MIIRLLHRFVRQSWHPTALMLDFMQFVCLRLHNAGLGEVRLPEKVESRARL